MSFKHTLSLTALVLSLSTGIVLAAEIPTNVKNVQARVNGDEITVLWSQVPAAMNYRVYYSHASILNNGGNYDDFEQTQNAQTTFVFAKAPLQSEKIYIGVLAVSQDGTESEGFETEAFVITPTPTPSSSSSLSSSSVSSSVAITTSSSSNVSSEASMPIGENPTSTALRMGIESFQVVSGTGMLVTFTKDLSPDAVITPDSFLITTASGIVLSIEKTDIFGKQILLITGVHTPDTEYVFSLLSAIQAMDGTNATPTEPQVRLRTAAKETAKPSIPQYGRNPNLPATVSPIDSVQTPKPTDRSDLPESGLGLLGIIALAGAEAGRRIYKKKLVV